MSSPILSPLTLRPPYNPVPIVVPSSGLSTNGAGGFDLYLRNLTTIIQQLAGINASYFGATGNGTTDDTAAIQTAVSTLANQGGGTLVLNAGTFKITAPIVFPVGSIPIVVVGQGMSTILLRGGTLTAGMGMLDISGSNVRLENFLIEGNVTVPVGLPYNGGFSTPMDVNDPMSPLLTTNSSIWVHGPVTNFSMSGVQIQHSGGYGVLLDCMPGSIFYVDISHCWFVNNRPNLFGTTSLIYGSWTGVVYVNGDGRTAGSGVLNSFRVSFCRFLRNTGNCLWSHLYGLNELHTAFRWTCNDFLDFGLDGMEVGGVNGVVVANNVFRRGGYICLDDTGQSTPLWGPAGATALDSSGLVLRAVYANNTFTSINGGFIDGDGLGLSTITGNTCSIPYPDDPLYAEDQIAITGVTNTGSDSYGYNGGNTNDTPYGGYGNTITDNSFINLSGGSIRLYFCRNCFAEGNTVIAPNVPINPPIEFGPGPGANQRATGLVVRGTVGNMLPPRERR